MSLNTIVSALRRRSVNRLTGKEPPRPAEGESPLRAELFALAQLESHGRLLASTQEVDLTPGPEQLLQRLRENERIIRESYEVVAHAVEEGRQAAPGAEWLLDNFYLIEEQIDIAREHLPPGYSRELPRLRTGPFKGYPRAYELALELVSHTDGQIDMENLSFFVRGFQSAQPLKLGELWAVPIMLRLALLENLRRVTYRVASRRRDRDRALEWVRRFLDVAQSHPKELITDLADFVRATPTMSQAFIAELCTGLQGQHASLALVIGWIEQDLGERGQTMDQILQAESNDQAADRVSIGNSITSLRTLTALDWHEFVEELSVTEQELRKDPLGIYAEMDFDTRDRYRHAVERLARWSGWLEQDVATEAVRLARQRQADPQADHREGHVGHFLIRGVGLPELEAAVGYHPPLYRRFGRWLRRHLPWVYVLATAVLTSVGAGLLMLQTTPLLVYGWVWTVPVALALLLFASQSVISLVNWLATLLIPTRGLPKLDFSDGIPDEHRAAVVVPTLLGSRAAADSLVENIEIRYLANRDPNLLFVLLTDFPDAPKAVMPDDEALLKRVAEGIRRLNAKYAEPNHTIFYLLHRPRLWNEAEQVWMGYERKRGKLMEFNALLRGGPGKEFATVVGDLNHLRMVRFVIPLDTDTQLPPETAATMVGTMAHTLNRPVLDPKTSCVTRGYGVLQPRVAIGLIGAGKSLFARLFAGEVGIDPYTREVSNVYHDLFGRSPFIGKGIYDVEAFDRAVRGRFRENRILSHDLIEGGHAQCGFLNDVELIEDHPSRYLADVRRRHRWVRGDWQIAAWLLPYVRNGNGQRVRNPLGRLPRWLIFDNLRRSLSPMTLLALLVAGWLALPDAQPVWTLLALGVYLAPEVLRTLWAVIAKPAKILWAAHLNRALLGAGRQLVINLLLLAFLPYEALMHVDGIVRVAWRLAVSHRHLLEWQTAHDAELSAGSGLVATFVEMWIAPAAALAITGVMTFFGIPIAPLLWPVLALWLVAPLLAWYLSRPLKPREARFTPAQNQFLRRLARRTWVYFEHFVGPSQNWLPPDNFQEQPQSRVTERTSPTNIGLALLSNLAAYDFGYVSTGHLIERTANTLATMEKLQKYRDHFLNWYDTWTCEPLQPAYVSTVDSGNLACCLVALRGGLVEMKSGRLVPPRWREGLEDTAGVLLGEAQQARGRIAIPQVRADLQEVDKVIRDRLAQLPEAGAPLPTLYTALRELDGALAASEPLCRHDASVGFWLAAMRRHVDDLRTDLAYTAPWLADGKGLSAGSAADAPTGEDPALEALREELANVATLKELARLDRRLGSRLDDLIGANGDPGRVGRLRAMREAISEASDRGAERIRRLDALAVQCEEMSEIDLDFLYDPTRKLLSIGFSLENRRRDPGYYDMFASEARQCSYLGIAQGSLPQEHWFLLSRQLTPGLEMPTLLSWSGSMFEYLMPMLIMPTYEGTLLSQACRGAVMRQINYGRRQHVPWGISESCYNQIDGQMNYQYRAFGVPELGLKRGLAEDLVIAPYASVMALMVAPEEACTNLQAMAQQGILGRFGFYEAIDYTSNRVPADQSYAVVNAFMAHHSGMGLLALAYRLLGQPMQRRFMADPRMRAADLLLQERVPPARASTRIDYHRQTPLTQRERAQSGREPSTRVCSRFDMSVPEVHLLSNGRYHVMVTSAGSGFSRWNQLALTRWHEDVTQDNFGCFFYLHDVEAGDTWGCTHQPIGREVKRTEAIFSQARAEFRVVHHEIEAYTQVSVSPEDDIELRRVTLTNLSGRDHTLELTSFAEVVLAEPIAEQSHPVFNALFIQTQVVPKRDAILCTRRARSDEESPPWMGHAMIVHGETPAPPASFETDRARFLGRCRTPAEPAAMQSAGPLSNTAGAVLDPCVAIRRRVHLAPGEAVVIDAITGAAGTRDGILTLIDRYHDRRLADRVFEMAWTQSQVLLHPLRATEIDAQLFARLAGSVIYANPRYRANSSLLARNRKGQADLWRYGISGDLPIVLVRVTDETGLELVRRAIQAHGYWRQKGLRVDLVIWADAFAGYRQSLWDQIMGIASAGPDINALDQPGGIFVRSTDQLSEDDRLLMQSVARLVLSDHRGSLSEQASRRRRRDTEIPEFRPTRQPEPILPDEVKLPPRQLELANGLGGFTPDGREYVIELPHGTTTPMPWSNVLANAEFGTVVTESGGGYTWFENAHEYRLTPWYNEPVSDTRGEAFYLRDEETGQFWSPTPLPAGGPTPYVCRHGLGYTTFEHTQHNIFSEMWTYVAIDAPVKFTAITLRNLSSRDRRLSVTGFCEWVLGQSRDRNAMHVVTRLDPQTGAIMASSVYNADFADRLAFFQTTTADRRITGDRKEFLGRNGSPADPAALHREHLSDHVGAGLDPCGAIQSFITIPAGQERKVVFVLGAARSEKQAYELLTRFAGTDGAWLALEAVWNFWKRLLGGVYVETPDPSVNLLTNHWLLYQVVASRIWGRSGFYQSGGAFGFRDQLQDSLALMHEGPEMIRHHLLHCAGRQFREGDVQHWWHPPTGRGVRTRFSDDFLWLPYATCQYITATGDTGVLDEEVPFLEGRAIGPSEESYYDMPQVTEERATLYEHCLRMVRHGMRYGKHGLPLIGCGDWNDGLNRVGIGGHGESVWLAFFYYDVLKRFADLARDRGDRGVAQQCLDEAKKLKVNIEANAWDGRWYRRAYFDNGQPLGAAENVECRIASLPQSWAVLSGAARSDRASLAMQSVLEHLVAWDMGLIRLFYPPFDKAPWDPGYIKGYLPGVRENGGQYTHAAVWVTMAFAALKQTEQAWRLFSLINPIHHGDTPERIATYKVEPYVVSADVYTARGHEGRGGWTWYTGSAAWMYRLLVENLLGLSLNVDTLTLTPTVPAEWKAFTIHYRYRNTQYHIHIKIVGPATWKVRKLTVDDHAQPEKKIKLVDDQLEHIVQVQVG